MHALAAPDSNTADLVFEFRGQNYTCRHAIRSTNGLCQRQVAVPYSAFPLASRESDIFPHYVEVAEADRTVELYTEPRATPNGVVYTRFADLGLAGRHDETDIGSDRVGEDRDENNLVILSED